MEDSPIQSPHGGIRFRYQNAHKSKQLVEEVVDELLPILKEDEE